VKKSVLENWVPDAEWTGGTAIVVGGGPSILELGHDKILPQLVGRYPIIACNAAFLIVPEADVLFGADQRFWRDFDPWLPKFRGWYMVSRRAPAGRLGYPLRLIRSEHRGGLSLNPAVIFGRNSGHMSLNLAVAFGAKRIIMVGLDLHERSKTQHFHSLHSRPASVDSFKTWRDDFQSAVPVLEKASVTVENANPGSSVRSFPFVNLETLI
jgi:hypothetical protein